MQFVKGFVESPDHDDAIYELLWWVDVRLGCERRVEESASGSDISSSKVRDGAPESLRRSPGSACLCSQ